MQAAGLAHHVSVVPVFERCNSNMTQPTLLVLFPQQRKLTMPYHHVNFTSLSNAVLLFLCVYIARNTMCWCGNKLSCIYICTNSSQMESCFFCFFFFFFLVMAESPFQYQTADFFSWLYGVISTVTVFTGKFASKLSHKHTKEKNGMQWWK